MGGELLGSGEGWPRGSKLNSDFTSSSLPERAKFQSFLLFPSIEFQFRTEFNIELMIDLVVQVRKRKQIVEQLGDLTGAGGCRPSVKTFSKNTKLGLDCDR